MEHNWFFPPHDGIRLGDLAAALGAELADPAEADRVVRSVSPVHRAKSGDLCVSLGCGSGTARLDVGDLNTADCAPCQ